MFTVKTDDGKIPFSDTPWYNETDREFLTLGALLIKYTGKGGEVIIDFSVKYIPEYVFSSDKVKRLEIGRNESLLNYLLWDKNIVIKYYTKNPQRRAFMSLIYELASLAAAKAARLTLDLNRRKSPPRVAAVSYGPDKNQKITIYFPKKRRYKPAVLYWSGSGFLGCNGDERAAAHKLNNLGIEMRTTNRSDPHRPTPFIPIILYILCNAESQRHMCRRPRKKKKQEWIPAYLMPLRGGGLIYVRYLP